MSEAQEHTTISLSSTSVTAISTPQEAVQLCRNAGRDGDYGKVIAVADAAIDQHRRNEQTRTVLVGHKNSPTRQMATILGYKGFALMKQEKFALALSSLEESQILRSEWDKNRTIPLPQREIRERDTVQGSLRQCYQRLGKDPPLPPLIKYPRTTHLFDMGGTSTTPDDLVLAGLEAILPTLCEDENMDIIIEEKVDGSNLGISLCPFSNKLFVQNRSHYVSSGEHPQYSRVTEWVEEHRVALTNILRGGNRILYGEWLVARHTIPYHKLPGLFVAFDIWDKRSEQFLSRKSFHSAMKGSRIPVTPTVVSTFSAASGNEVREKLVGLLETESKFRNDGGTVEGIVIRMEEKGSQWLNDKYKIVRPDFIQGINEGQQHWATRQIDKQSIDFAFVEEYLESCYPFADEEGEREGANRVHVRQG